MSEFTSLGQRLAEARKRRHMSQEQLAGLSGISIGVIRKLEQGQRDGARMDTVAALAKTLDVPIAELLGVQPGFGPGQAADVATIRAAIYDRSTNHEPPGLDQLRDQLVDLRGMYWHARFAILAGEIPGQLAACRAAVRAAQNDDERRAANGLLAETLQTTASLVTHLAYEDLAHVALMEGLVAADAAEDPLLIASQQSTRAWVLSRQGLWQQAQQLATSAASGIEPVLSQATSEQIGLWGQLLHFGMVALAREGRDDEAHELLGLVQAAGHAMGDRQPASYKTQFSQTWAAHSAVQLHQATDNPRQALRAAKHVEHPEQLPPSVHARFLLNFAWAAMLEWKSQDALTALRKIEEITPELLRHHGLAKQIVEELMPRRRTENLPGLLGIAERIGVTR